MQKLGAHKFVVTKDEKQLQSVTGYFDFILDTVSAPHDLNLYISLLKTKEYMCVLEYHQRLMMCMLSV